MSQEPPIRKSEGAALAPERPRADRPRKDDDAARAQVSPVELPADMVRSM